MSRHSVQIRTLLQTRRLSKSRFNPERSMNYIPDSSSQIRNLKRSDSSSSLRKQPNPDHTLIEQRYIKLEQGYKQLFQETKVKAQIFTKQKQELEICKQQRQKDKKQIERLRSMLGFLKKKDFAVQVDSQSEFRCSYDKDISKISTYSKAQQSTDAGLRQTGQCFRQTGQNWHTMDRSKSKLKQSRLKNLRIQRQGTPVKLYDRAVLTNKSATFLPCYQSSKSNKMRSPLSKYKFVPTLSLN